MHLHRKEVYICYRSRVTSKNDEFVRIISEITGYKLLPDFHGTEENRLTMILISMGDSTVHSLHLYVIPFVSEKFDSHRCLPGAGIWALPLW